MKILLNYIRLRLNTSLLILSYSNGTFSVEFDLTSVNREGVFAHYECSVNSEGVLAHYECSVNSEGVLAHYECSVNREGHG
jgi:hypothetical protein